MDCCKYWPSRVALDFYTVIADNLYVVLLCISEICKISSTEISDQFYIDVYWKSNAVQIQTDLVLLFSIVLCGCVVVAIKGEMSQVVKNSSEFYPIFWNTSYATQKGEWIKFLKNYKVIKTKFNSNI